MAVMEITTNPTAPVFQQGPNRHAGVQSSRGGPNRTRGTESHAGDRIAREGPIVPEG
jgi:hypothetical protein